MIHSAQLTSSNRNSSPLAGILFLCLCCEGLLAAAAAPPGRIAQPIDSRQGVPLVHSVRRLALPQYDRGEVAANFQLPYMMLLLKPSTVQQSELDRLLKDQINPSSPQFHRWLTPEQFGNRFGLNTSDHAKVAAWLKSEGFNVVESGRARNWLAFSGTAGQVQHTFHTSIHHYEITGEKHFANAMPISIPAALSDIASAVAGLDDFNPKPALVPATPPYTSGTSHSLAPEDFATIYDITPIYNAGVNGAGVSLGVIGLSTIVLTDIEQFRSRFNLPANDPKTVVVGSNPGVNASWETEADLDLEWSGAVAPGAAITFYYSTNFFTAMTGAINANNVQVISMSFQDNELDYSVFAYQPIIQQANAQGITLLAATGDYGATQQPYSLPATLGPQVAFPADLPEVTAVGGTQFSEGAGTYWGTTNSANLGSAISYIPEVAWSGSGGGASALLPKPAWQTGPGVPQDGARDVPDVALTASTHDAYLMTSGGVNTAAGGTSASTPSMAGIVVLLNQYLAKNGVISAPGLGNINPQVYRLWLGNAGAFHDITSGSNIEGCVQGTLGCANGSFGFTAGPGYDQVTGLGSLDVNSFFSGWSVATDAVTVTLQVTPAQPSLNDNAQLTARVVPVSGAGSPTGNVDFGNGSLQFGSAALDPGTGTASLSVPAWRLGTGTVTITANYEGDAAFSQGGASAKVKTSVPSGAAVVVPVVPSAIYATTDPAGPFWQFSLTLQEYGGTAALLTGFAIDGQPQPVAQYFPSQTLPALGTLTSSSIVLRNQQVPLSHTFTYTGIDTAGDSWAREFSVLFLGQRDAYSVDVTAAPLTISQNPDAAPGCQWSQEVLISEATGYAEQISSLSRGNVSITSQIPLIFGTTRLAPFGTLTGTVCWPDAEAGATDALNISFATGIVQGLAATFAGPDTNPAAVSVAPAALNLAAATPDQPAQASLSISVPDGQPWTLSVFPPNLTTNWLNLSQTSGLGSAQVAVQASGAGFTQGAYGANIVLQGPNLAPGFVNIPVAFGYGDPTGLSISGITNAASGKSVVAPGSIAMIKGSGLAKSGLQYTSGPYGFSLGGTSVTVNGVSAALKSATATQIYFQVPFETSAGPAVVGVNNNGNAIGYSIQVAGSAPGIYADANGFLTPTNTVVSGGKAISFTITGDGDDNGLADGGTVSSSSSNYLYKPKLPLSVTVGGNPVFVTSYGTVSGSVGVTTINIQVPAGTPTGVQPVVVTVGGVDSPPVSVNVQ